MLLCELKLIGNEYIIRSQLPMQKVVSLIYCCRKLLKTVSFPVPKHIFINELGYVPPLLLSKWALPWPLVLCIVRHFIVFVDPLPVNKLSGITVFQVSIGE